MDKDLEKYKDKRCYWCNLPLDQHTKESRFCRDDRQIHVKYVGLTTFTPNNEKD